MLDDLKILLGIDVSDRDSDEKLLLILESVRNRLKLLLGGMEVPSSMQHIVTDVAVIRFNRIGSEGMSSHSVAGESTSYNENDFSAYMDEIQAYLDSVDGAKRGRVRFLLGMIKLYIFKRQNTERTIQRLVITQMTT